MTVSLLQPMSAPSCTDDDGAGDFFHFGPSGACLLRGAGGAPFLERVAIRPDGRTAALSPGTIGARVTMFRAGEMFSNDVDLLGWIDGGMPHGAAWSPDGTRFAYGYLVPDPMTPVGGVGVVRYRP